MDVIYEAYLIFIKGNLKYTPPQGQISAATAVIDSHYLSKNAKNFEGANIGRQLL